MTADEWIASDGYQRYRKDGEEGEAKDRAVRKMWEEYPELEHEEFRRSVYDLLMHKEMTTEEACERALHDMDHDYLHYMET